ncbi:hypothetical protein HCH_03676 [Hahella chejuensis KCTC 2396]|uniref:Uncharacterized protein n=1 Tax=Hahella chejuensis (strain KCTC 2396) TaxID=349521 RepID=Q2SG07_HAHCH|nr:hypothetical protein HCH_03676 [Hahella chejuensis KCTC 2396]
MFVDILGCPSQGKINAGHVSAMLTSGGRREDYFSGKRAAVARQPEGDGVEE